MRKSCGGRHYTVTGAEQDGSVAVEVTGADMAGNIGTGSESMTLDLPWRLPNTGQDKCYDNSTETACPQSGDFYGQDAQYSINSQSFRDLGDGTVRDVNTRLVWQKEDDNQTRTWDTEVAHPGNEKAMKTD